MLSDIEISRRATLRPIAEIAAKIGLAPAAIEPYGHLIDWLHEAQAEGARAVLLNAGAYTHTSIALYDAIKAIVTPVIEVHLSNPHTREPMRRASYVGMAAKGTIAGFGAQSYLLALEAAAAL